jgi:hypothetical protein
MDSQMLKKSAPLALEKVVSSSNISSILQNIPFPVEVNQI